MYRGYVRVLSIKCASKSGVLIKRVKIDFIKDRLCFALHANETILGLDSFRKEICPSI